MRIELIDEITSEIGKLSSSSSLRISPSSFITSSLTMHASCNRLCKCNRRKVVVGISANFLV